jgi:transposase
MVELMQAGQSWQEAAHCGGMQTSRSAASPWWQAYRRQGDAAPVDGRHGHPSKACELVLNFLDARWSQAPQTRRSTLQKEVQNEFGQVICMTQLYRLRKASGLATPPEKKTPLPRILLRTSVARGSRWTVTRGCSQ